MKILIVGGAGYVGGAVTDVLIREAQHEIIVYDNLLFEETYRKNCNFIFGDVRDKSLLKKYLSWADVVIWLAALVGDAVCEVNKQEALFINSKALQYAVNNFAGRILFTSTCSVYGKQEAELTENSPISPLSVYAITKLRAEECLHDKNAIIFRLGTLFGISDLFSRIRFDLVLNTLALNAITKGVLTIYGGQQFRPILHVKDAARALCAEIDTEHTGIFNLCERNITITDLAQIVLTFFPKTKIGWESIDSYDARDYRVSTQAAREILGFIPELTPEDGIVELKKLLEEGRIRYPHDPRYTNQKFIEINSGRLKEGNYGSATAH